MKTNGIQMTLDVFDPGAAAVARDNAILQVDAHADPAWKAIAEEIVYELAQADRPFTTDDVWRELTKRGTGGPHEPRAMGAIMRRLQGQGVIKTMEGGYQRSTMVTCHRRPKQVWIGV